MSKEMYCINCGQAIPDDAQFCHHCGAATPNNTSDFEAPSPIEGSDNSSKDNSKEKDPEERKVEEIIKDFKDKRLSNRAKVLFMASYIFNTAAIPGLMIIGLFLYPLIFLLLLVLYFIAIYITAELAHNNFRYRLTKTGFEKEHGILHKRSVTIPYVQIQNINITRNFIDRISGLTRLSIETAGSTMAKPRRVVGGGKAHAEAHLPGVTHREGKQLHDALFLLANKYDNS